MFVGKGAQEKVAVSEERREMKDTVSCVCVCVCVCVCACVKYKTEGRIITEVHDLEDTRLTDEPH